MPVAAQQAARHADEVSRGERFEFGANWQAFLDVLDDRRIAEAERSLQQMLGVESLSGRSFLDVGSGSGLFSLAARRLGAERVRSFDFDPSSVACTRELRRRFFPDDPGWTVEEASVLDEGFVRALGRWDVVYSWGVLHHTGAMWRAIDLTQSTVGDGGRLFLSIYNDQGRRSHMWRRVKRAYNLLPEGLRPLLTLTVMGPHLLMGFVRAALAGRALSYIRSWVGDRTGRGMSRWHDLVDWVGGYPFEVAKPEQVLEVLSARGFVLERLATVGGGLGCNQYVFRRTASSGD
jgi:2-polyprenyl-6-hydroxyphenyl methylase/3-demethylubiquinone-9 3-methyltransferase